MEQQIVVRDNIVIRCTSGIAYDQVHFLVSLQSNPAKKIRHIIHEITHLLTWSESKPHRIPSWIDEGVAEVISCLAVKNSDLLCRGQLYYQKNKDIWSFQNLNHELNQLSSLRRGEAFLYSIGAVIFYLKIDISCDVTVSLHTDLVKRALDLMVNFPSFC